MKIRYTNNVPKSSRSNGYKNCRLQAVIDAFAARPETCLVLTWEEGDPHKDVNSLYSCYKIAVKRSKRAIRVCKCKDEVWLIKILETESP